jgi:predicted MFS family arabinose efflux permease
MRVSPRLATLIASYGLFGFGYVITATFLVAIVRGSPAIRLLEPAIWALFGLAAIPSVALWSALGRRIGTLAAYSLACLVEAAGVAASVLVPNAIGAVLAAVFLGGTIIGLTALGLVAARGLTASDPRRVLALMTGAFGLGQIVGPALAGALFDRTGSFTPATLLAALALVAAAALTGALALRTGR